MKSFNNSNHLRAFLTALVIWAASNLTAAQESAKKEKSEEFYRRGLAASKANDCGEAITQFDRAIELNPRDARFHKERGACSYTVEEQRRFADEAIRLEPDYAEAYFERGKTYLERQMTAANARRALNDFNRAISLDPKNPEFYYQRGKLYSVHYKDLRRAEIDLDKMVALGRGDSEYLMIRTMYYRSTKQFRKAVADCTTILKTEPRNFDALSQRGINYFELAEYEKAIADFTAAIEVKPEYAGQVYDNRAKAYRKLGKLREAERDEKARRELDALEDEKYKQDQMLEKNENQ